MPKAVTEGTRSTLEGNTSKKTFRSNGKLLITGEYVVLDGTKALAIPTKYGQSLTVEENNTETIVWKSFNEKGEIWFEDAFKINNPDFLKTVKKDFSVSSRLIQILKSAQILNPDFLRQNQGYTVTTHLDFNIKWGLGTSSTLINNIANWAEIDAYKLLAKTFGGSGYDIACAQNGTPITYQLINPRKRIIEEASFNPSFKSHLYFVYLNQKQNSRDGIKAYKALGKVSVSVIKAINQITKHTIRCTSISDFVDLITKHEDLIADLIQQPTIKSKWFSDFDGAIKSLGAWGGDFVLVTSEVNPKDYFKSKGFETIIPYKEMVLN
nr:GYDIA family GHMP kinase [Winogradskyella sp.]